jgi:hypothetical protein
MLSAVGGTYTALSGQLTQIQERQAYNLSTVTEMKERLSSMETRMRSLELDTREERRERNDNIGK